MLKMPPPPDGPPYEMADSKSLSNEQKTLSASCKWKYNFLCSYLCHCKTLNKFLYQNIADHIIIFYLKLLWLTNKKDRYKKDRCCILVIILPRGEGIVVKNASLLIGWVSVIICKHANLSYDSWSKAPKEHQQMLKNHLLVSCIVWGYGIFYSVCKNDWSLFFFSLISHWTQIILRITSVWKSHWQVPMVMFVVLIIRNTWNLVRRKWEPMLQSIRNRTNGKVYVIYIKQRAGR